MATFIKRPSGWLVRVRLKGKSKSKTFHTKAEATAWADQEETAIKEGRAGVVPSTKTFGDLLSRFSEARGKPKEKIRVDWYLRESEIAKVPLTQLSPRHIAEWRDSRLKQVSAASVRREWNMLSAACSMAVKEWGWLTVNPMSSVKAPADSPARTRRYTDDELKRLLLALGHQEGVRPSTAMQRVALALLFALETAMRAGEICGLTWDNVDKTRRVAHLPMTKNGFPRDVPLSTKALAVLSQLGTDEGSVFNLTPASLDALFRKAKAKALVEDLHFHDARREALTRLSTRFNVMELARISGHRDLKMLLNVYYAPDASELAKKMD